LVQNQSGPARKRWDSEMYTIISGHAGLFMYSFILINKKKKALGTSV